MSDRRPDPGHQAPPPPAAALDAERKAQPAPATPAEDAAAFAAYESLLERYQHEPWFAGAGWGYHEEDAHHQVPVAVLYVDSHRHKTRDKPLTLGGVPVLIRVRCDVSAQYPTA